MNATSLYVSTCRLVLQANPEDPGCWTDLYRLIPYLRQSLSCTVCGNLLIEPYTPTETNCQHHVCRSCKGGKKKLKPSCSWCKNYEKYVENVQLRILLQCYKKLCEYIINSSIYRLMCKTTASGDTNIANMTDLIQEGAGFKDEFKSNSGLSKSAYSVLPCIYASASTQTITEAISVNNDSEIAVDEDVSVAKSNLSNGSSIYSVTYAGSGNKMVIKRKAMLNKGEMENCENLRLIKGSNFKKPIHRRGNFRGRGRGFKEEEKTNSTGVNSYTVSSNNLNNGKMNVKKKKLGCRCGNATASPGKLTCCGQRCPCYVDSKACLDCKCRGCRNPHTKEGQKVIRDPLDTANSELQPTTQLQTDEGIPTKGNENFRAESRPSLQHEKKYRGVDESETFSAKQQKEIAVTVESIENVDESKVKEVIVKIDFIGNILNHSFQTSITNNRADIGLTGFINVDDTNPYCIDEILCNPVLFTVLDCTMPSPIPTGSSSPLPYLEKETKKKTSKASNSPISGSKSFVTSTNILGICNLDIGSLVTGEKRIKEVLLVESEKKVAPPDIVPWVRLPKLVVVASTGDEPLILESASKFNNVVGVTIESVYNVPEYIPDGSFFDANIPVPSIGNKIRKIKFPNGVITTLKDFICRKKWLSLPYVEGRGGRSKHRVSPDICDVINTIDKSVNLNYEIKKQRKMIQWNMWRSCLMFKDDVSYFYSKIMKYQFWPVEIVLSNKPKELPQKDKSAKSDKKSKPAPSASITNSDHFTAFLNLTPLLYPGVTKVRVAAQLFTYSQTDLLKKFGEEFMMSQSQVSVGTLKTKATSVRSRASVGESEEIKDSPGVPVFDDEGSPTFIIVEVELLKPFNRKRDPEQLELDLKAQLSLKGKLYPKTSNLVSVQEIFWQSVKDAVSILTQEYQDFSLSLKKNNNFSEDFDVAFQKFLCKRENFYKIKTTLENKVIGLINEKYGAVSQYKEKIPEIYIYLVNEMHRITNKCFVGQEDISSNYFNNDNLQLYAEEAIEEGDYELGKNYLLLKLSRDTSNPNYWLDYATYFISQNQYEMAIESIKEALYLDFNHQIGLLMYAVLMAMSNNGIVAEMAFEILLTKYPNFTEGWIALWLFYSTVNNSEGGLVAFQEAKKLESEKKMQTAEMKMKSEETLENSENECSIIYACSDNYDSSNEGKYGIASFKNGASFSEPLSWTITFCPPDNINIKTAILLQKLGFYEYAFMSLSQELIFSVEDKCFPLHYVYYTSVNYYLRGLYEEVIPLLQDFVKEYGKNCFLWSLMGHCYYKLGNHSKAISCYEYVMESYNRPDDLHLIYSRMGFYYIQAKKFPCAKQILKLACKYSPTPRLWKGLGTACIKMEEAEEAETAFSEANYLDNKDPETWAYLALTNAMLRRLDLFKQCYSEARKRGLKNPEIIKEIKVCGLLNGLKNDEF